MGWPDMSEMFPGLPKGIFELRSVGQCAVPPELSSTEGTKKIQMIAFHFSNTLYFILSSTEIIKFTRKAKARGLNGLVSIIIIEDC